MKMHMYVSDPALYLEGNRRSCFSYSPIKVNVRGWVYMQEVEFEANLEVSIDKLLAALNYRELAMAQNDA